MFMFNVYIYKNSLFHPSPENLERLPTHSDIELAKLCTINRKQSLLTTEQETNTSRMFSCVTFRDSLVVPID